MEYGKIIGRKTQKAFHQLFNFCLKPIMSKGKIKIAFIFKTFSAKGLQEQ